MDRSLMPPIPTGWGDRSFKDTLQFGKGKAPIYVGSDDEEDEGGGHGCSPKPGSASRVGGKAFRTLDANSQQTSQEESATW